MKAATEIRITAILIGTRPPGEPFHWPREAGRASAIDDPPHR